MPRPAPTHTETARTWTARLADGRRIQFSAPTEQLADRLIAEARTERTQIADVTTTFPPAGWPKLHGEIVGARAMTTSEGRADRARAA